MTTRNLDIATKIKRARQAAGLTQAQAAVLAGIPLSSYQAYEQGKATPPYERVEVILAALSEAVVSSDVVTAEVKHTDEPGVFYLILSMNNQPFYRFRCIGEVLGDVRFEIDLEATVQPRDDPDEVR